MSADMTDLKKILEQNIGDVYKNALASIGEPSVAMEVTRRVMALLKRTYEAGLSVTPDTIKRLTEDCCREQASYNSKKASFRDGVIADMPDFDTAISAITKEEADAKGRSDAEDRAAEAYRAAREAAAIAASTQRPQPQPQPQTQPQPRVQVNTPPLGEEAPRRRYTCVADLFEGFDQVVNDVINGEPEDWEKEMAPEPVKAPEAKPEAPKPEKKPEPRARKKSRKEADQDDEPDVDLMDDDDDDDDIEPLFEKRQKTPAVALIAVYLLIAILFAVAFCLAVMLMERDVLPWGDSQFVEIFTEWFNSNIFPLF